MRIYVQRLPEERIRSWFAWFPVRIRDEVRWLETVTVKQRMNTAHPLGGPLYFEEAFIDSKEGKTDEV